MKRNRLIVSGLLAASFLAVVAVAPAAGSNGSVQGSHQRANGTEYRANLSGQGTLMGGQAKYRERSRRGAITARLDIEVEDAQPNTTYAVSVNGVEVGSITTNGLGGGEITFRNPSDDPGDLPNVPAIKAGDVIAVGPVAGSMN